MRMYTCSRLDWVVGHIVLQSNTPTCLLTNENTMHSTRLWEIGHSLLKNRSLQYWYNRVTDLAHTTIFQCLQGNLLVWSSHSVRLPPPYSGPSCNDRQQSHRTRLTQEKQERISSFSHIDLLLVVLSLAPQDQTDRFHVLGDDYTRKFHPVL